MALLFLRAFLTAIVNIGNHPGLNTCRCKRNLAILIFAKNRSLRFYQCVPAIFTQKPIAGTRSFRRQWLISDTSPGCSLVTLARGLGSFSHLA